MKTLNPLVFALGLGLPRHACQTGPAAAAPWYKFAQPHRGTRWGIRLQVPISTAVRNGVRARVPAGAN